MSKEVASSYPAEDKDSQVVQKLDKSGLGEPLYEPKDGKATVDIVFVHGINGDRIDTWTHKGNNEMWPKDFLPEKLPDARIVSFGYNAQFAGFYPGNPQKVAPELTIDDYSNSLLESVRSLRNGEEVERPIIFVAHSMGGLVVANALSRDLKSSEALQAIPDHTIGALFLGTPFHGSSLASYGSIAEKLIKYITHTQPHSMQTLVEKSEKLVDINAKFAKFLRNRDQTHGMPRLRLACFFEGLPISSKTLVVSKESATWPGVDALPIDEDHVAMCRFDRPERDGFKKVSGTLLQWIKEYEASKTGGGMGGMNAQSINVSGNVDYQNAHLWQSNTNGHIVATTPGAYRLNQQWHNGPGDPSAAQASQKFFGVG